MCEIRKYPLPLNNLTILDLSQAIAGPLCAKYAQDFGAKVFHVEPISGDLARKLPPFLSNNGTPISTYFATANSGKESICVDTTTEDGQKIIHQLIKDLKIDALVVNRPSHDSLRKNGIDVDTLEKFKKDIIVIAISMFGFTGPYAGALGYDLQAQAASGSLYMTGDGSEPFRFPGPVVDVMTAMNAFNGLLLALRTRDLIRGKSSQFIDISLLNSFAPSLFNLISEIATFGKDKLPEGNRYPYISPYTTLPAKNGSFLTIAIGAASNWKVFCNVMGLDYMITDPKFATNEARVANNEELEEIICKILMEKTAKEWHELFQKNRVPAQEVLTVQQFINNPQTKARRVTEELKINEQIMVIPSNPLICSNIAIRSAGLPPNKGQHTEKILKLLGYSDKKIENLRINDVINNNI